MPKDQARAVDCYLKAAKRGHGGAMANLGLCYDEAQGVPQDHVRAAEWYWKGAQSGNAIAMYNLGICFACGLGVPRDRPLGIQWLHESAKRGFAKANATIWKINSDTSTHMLANIVSGATFGSGPATAMASLRDDDSPEEQSIRWKIRDERMRDEQEQRQNELNRQLDEQWRRQFNP